MTDAEHESWMREHNPLGWGPEKLRAFVVRCGTDPAFAGRCKQAKRERMFEVAKRYADEMDGRRVSARFRIRRIRQLHVEVELDMGRPDPFADGWTLPERQGQLARMVVSPMD